MLILKFSDNSEYHLIESRIYKDYFRIQVVDLYKQHKPDEKVRITDKGKLIEECILSDIFEN